MDFAALAEAVPFNLPASFVLEGTCHFSLLASPRLPRRQRRPGESTVSYITASRIPVCPRMMLVISEEAPYPAEVSAFTQIS